jgi:predicted nucleic acid-binding protein
VFLLDTNVLSAIRKREPAASEWLSRIERGTSWVSVVSLGEIAKGVAMKQRRDPATARHLSQWLSRVHQAYRDRIFDIDDQIALEWGRIDAIRTRGVPDALIAATALVHDLTLVTRNTADFADTGVRLFNPWQP